ncbi:MAG: magnesium transporter [Candidatus Xenolissoclinum pacificiensis L6]|uniref:Magnesium transporter MgtE n=1 Tax=Candidatus Xenolissoclinum pacificiensis L6 TaxID=1401685 RepID=W2V0B3_9RICK|nr:MAG: magnesium transporter [Candidatus Xenolissoclinum pacificiensis L6]
MDKENYKERLTYLLHAKERDDVNSYDVIEYLDRLDIIEIKDFLVTTTKDSRIVFYNNYLQYYLDVIEELPLDIIYELYDITGCKNFVRFIRYLPTDTIFQIIEDFALEDQIIIVDNLPIEKRQILKEFLSYPEESAGRIIDKDFVVLSDKWNIDQVIDFMRACRNVRKLQELFIVDDDFSPIGKISVHDILCNKRSTKIIDIMETDIHNINVDQDQEAVAQVFENYSLISAPVIDRTGKMVGLINVDDVIDVIKEEAEEDILHLGNVSESDLNVGWYTTFRRRLPWLFITFCTINLTSMVVGVFDNVLEHSVNIAILMPVMAALSGNAAIQSSTVCVCGIATKQLTSSNIMRLLMKELIVGLVNGFVMGICMFIVIVMRFHNILLELSFISAMLLVITISTCIGSAIPFLIHRVGLDPALGSSILTSSLTDLMAFFLLLFVATMIIL